MVHVMDHLVLDGSSFRGRFRPMGGEIERRSIAAQLADRIEREIRTSVWADELPGKRTLADRYGVNVKTAASAIDLLCRRGLLGPARAGMGRAILPSSEISGARKKRGGKRLLVIHQSGGGLNLEDYGLGQLMAGCWEKHEGEVAWTSVDFPHCKSPGPLLDLLIQRHGPHALLLLSPGGGWHRAAAERLPFYMAGGPFEADLPLSLGACAIDHEVKRVVKLLRDLGHRRILAPSGGRSERVWRSIVDGLEADAGSKPDRGTWEDYCPRFPEHVPDAWAGYWKKAFMRVDPTAVIVFDDTALLSLYGHCSSQGLRIPRDLTVVSMNYEPRFEWLMPRPAMMRYPLKPAVAHFQQWIKGGLKPVGRKYFPLAIVEGESVARPQGLRGRLSAGSGS
jgi:hypothetical protein